MLDSPLAISTVSDALQQGRMLLQPSASASIDAQILLAHVLGRSRAFVLAHTERSLSEPEARAYGDLLEQRQRGVPVAYLRGTVEWYGTNFRVSSAVLVPRPETELLLERALRFAESSGLKTIVDVGTGSGALAAQLALHLPAATIFACDTSTAALAVAAHNLRELGLSDRVHLLYSDLCSQVPSEPDLIVANLPYLSDDMMEELPVDVRHEPREALYGGRSGLELYGRLFQQMRERGWHSTLLIEFDPRQELLLTELVARELPGWSTVVEADYAGLARTALIAAAEERA